jgi:hypothetical protein
MLRSLLPGLRRGPALASRGVRGMATIDVPVREAINMGIDEEMARDDKVFIMGASRQSSLARCPTAHRCSLNQYWAKAGCPWGTDAYPGHRCIVQGRRWLSTRVPTR